MSVCLSVCKILQHKMTAKSFTPIFREHNLATAGFVLESLTEVFPDTQVVPSLGNHEPFPCNM